MFTYKIDVLDALKQKGYTTYILRNKKFLSETSIAHLRNNEMVSLTAINAICCMLHLKPNDVICYNVTDAEKVKYYI